MTFFPAQPEEPTMSYRGSPIHCEVDSPDAHLGVAFTLYYAGSLTAFALAANQTIAVTDIVFISTAGGTYSIVGDSDAAGRRVAKGNASALGGLAHRFEEPVVLAKGVTPKLFAAAGQVTCVLQGFVNEV
jgi:hypothetical protein